MILFFTLLCHILTVSYNDISVPILGLHGFNVVCILDRHDTMLTFTEFAGKSNAFQPQKDLKIALGIG